MTNIDELLAAWDRGATIWTLDMGGMGPGYEQAIQVTAVEFARAGKDMPRTNDDQADYATFGALCDAALKKFDEQLGGITGAMYGAAKWLAWKWCFGGGPVALIEEAKKQGQGNRAIQCSSQGPRVPSSPGEAFAAGVAAGKAAKQ
jgi:hypothetical protein